MIKFIEMHNVEYGECIVLGNENNMLMTDCGSMNFKIHEADISFKNYILNYVFYRYLDIKKRTFLLTHFHKDHINGLYYILKNQKNYFDKILIPSVSINKENRAILIELALYASLFLPIQCKRSQISTSALKIFQFLKNTIGIGHFFTLKQNNTFLFDNEIYEVLWPKYSNFNFGQSLLNSLLTLDSYISNKFLKSKELFCNEYINCSNLCNISNNINKKEIESSISKLSIYLKDLKFEASKIKNSNIFPKILKTLEQNNLPSIYSSDQNSSSLVFHNKDILMTGDAMPKVFNEIQYDLLQKYKIIKAPHHGTNSGFSDILNKIPTSHILISNGNYHTGGKISNNYYKSQSIIHCTNNCSCDFFKNNQNSCNRLKVCESYNNFIFKCPSIKNIENISNCKIYIISTKDDKNCNCEN